MSLSTSFKAFHQQVKESLAQIGQRFSMVNGNPGGVLFSNGDGVEFDTLLKLTPMLASGSEVENTKGYAESFERVFENWQRISRSSSPTHNETGDVNSLVANYDETQTWVYDETLDLISSGINSATLIGFISPQPIENYTAEVILRSTNGDDDYIGLCIALAYDEEGIPHTLDVMRVLMGSAPP